MIKPGRWVVVKGEVGILDAFEQGAGIVHFTDAKGETVRIESVDVADIAEATRMDIPAPRRPDIALATDLGYQ